MIGVITQSIIVQGDNRIRTAEKWWGWGRRGKRKRSGADRR